MSHSYPEVCKQLNSPAITPAEASKTAEVLKMKRKRKNGGKVVFPRLRSGKENRPQPNVPHPRPQSTPHHQDLKPPVQAAPQPQPQPGTDHQPDAAHTEPDPLLDDFLICKFLY